MCVCVCRHGFFVPALCWLFSTSAASHALVAKSEQKEAKWRKICSRNIYVWFLHFFIFLFSFVCSFILKMRQNGMKGCEGNSTKWREKNGVKTQLRDIIIGNEKAQTSEIRDQTRGINITAHLRNKIYKTKRNFYLLLNLALPFSRLYFPLLLGNVPGQQSYAQVC